MSSSIKFEEDINTLRKYINSKCPINDGASATLLENTFKRMCSAHCRKNSRSMKDAGYCSKMKTEGSLCKICKIPEKIKSGEQYTPPAGITIDNTMIIHGYEINKEYVDIDVNAPCTSKRRLPRRRK